MKEKKKKGLFSLLWASIKACIFIIIFVPILAFLALLGGCFLPVLVFAIPIIFIICIMILLE